MICMDMETSKLTAEGIIGEAVRILTSSLKK